MSTAKVAIKSARAYLRDLNGITWTDSILLPFLQEAHGELIQNLELNDIGVIKRTSAVILVPAFASMLPFQPDDIVEPINMMERRKGGNKDDFIDMHQANFLPEDEPYFDRLRLWVWNAEFIQFVGCTSDREVILRYNGALRAPENLNSQLGFIFAERYLGPRVASLALASIEKDNSFLENIAQTALYKLIQTNVVGDQRPVRRRAYRSRKYFRGFGFGLTVSGPNPTPASNGSIEDMAFTAPSNNPDGVTTNFNFGSLPKFIVYNGLIQFENIGYTVGISGSNYVVTLKDIAGNTITPEVGDVIREAV